GDSDELAAKAQWFLQESAAGNLIFCLNKTKNPSYQTVCALADALAEASKVLPSGAPLLVVTRHDFAKALGQAVARRMADRPAVCIDSVFTEQGDYLDLGRPLLDGMVIPVVVKTLVFG
ncbi:MAG: ethanolamine ammonia-lyase reactivating factor EutA, partial [Oscillospiraceae bacterium]